MKNLIVVASAFLISFYCSGQEVILRGGLVISRLSASGASDENYDIHSGKGFSGAAGLSFPIGKRFALQGEINFIQKGAIVEFEIYRAGLYWVDPSGSPILEPDDVVIRRDLSLNYLEVPLLVKWATGESKFVYLYGGASIAYGLGGKSKYSDNVDDYDVGPMTGNDGDRISYTGSAHSESLDKRIDLGAQAGFQIHFGDSFLLDFRYILGISEFKYSSAHNFRILTRNNAFQFSVGIPISLGR